MLAIPVRILQVAGDACASGPRARGRRRAALLAPTVVALLVPACDVPTAVPKWDTVWAVPIDSTSIAVGDLLPPTGALRTDGTAFLVDLPETPVSLTLAELCPLCERWDGRRARKPATRVSFGAELAFPDEVVSITIAGGEITLETTNGLTFDPIRPSRTARGWWSATVLSDRDPTDPIGTDTVDGTETAMPPGRTRFDRFALEKATVSGLTFRYTIDSPAGDPVRFETSSALSIDVAARALRATEVVVSFSPQEIAAPPIEIDLSGFEPSFIENIRGGALVLDVHNPFELEGDLRLAIEAPDATIRRTVHFQPGTSRARVELNHEQLRALFGEGPVQYRISATVSASSGELALRPSQVLAVGTRLDVVVGPEG